MKSRFLLLCFGVVLLSACSTTDVVNTWKDDSQNQKFSNVLVVAVSKEQAYRSLIEHELVNTIKTTGADAKATVDILPNTDLIDEAAASATIKETGADAVMVVRLVDTKKEVVYTVGTSYVQGGYGGRYNRGWYGYYGSGYQVVSSPGYSTEYSVSTVETTLFDAATNKRVWSTITTTAETTIASAIVSYLKAIGKPIKESGLFE